VKPAGTRPRLHGWRAHGLLLLSFAVLAFPVVAHQAVTNTALSIFDEWQYADRVHRVAEGDLFMPHGELISDWGQSTRACRGIVRVAEPVPAPCVGGTIGDTPNSAAADPPPYFLATGGVAAALVATGMTDSVLIAGRLAGTLWAAVSMWTLFLLARAMGAGRAASLVAASTVLLVPALQQQYTFITPHALDVPVGALAALATLRFLRREWPWWTPVLAGLGVAGVKGSNVVVVVGLGIALLAVVCWPGAFDRATRVRAVVAGALLGGSTIVFTLVWMLVVRLTQIGDPEPPGSYEVDSLDPLQLTYDSFRFLAPYGENALGAPATWFTMAMTGTALAVWSGLARDDRPFVRQLAPGYLLGAGLGPLVLDLMVFVTTGQYIGMHTRYGLALWPLGLGFLALLLRTRTSLVLAVVGLVLYALTPGLAGLDSVAM
jgi:hypothetical protein